MVMVRIRSGLGNQLFQYATGRRLAHANNVRLKLDITSYSTNPHRSYMLHCFNVNADIATKEDIDRALCDQHEKSKPQNTVIREKCYEFDPTVLGLRGNFYLDGHWQSEKYFRDIEEIVRKELTLKTILDPRNRIMADGICSSNAVSIHVRRGDYYHIPSVYKVHGVLPLDYYRRAISLVRMNVNRPHFYVFSDEPEWARINLGFVHPMTVVDTNTSDQAHEDLRLMSLCKHHIIANSTLSWWGAWLCTHTAKIVCVPERWFKKDGVNTQDLIPPSWIKLAFSKR